MRLRKSDLFWGLLAGVIAVTCIPNETVLEGGKYDAHLKECNIKARTLCESIACENDWRGRAGRFPREVPNHCRPLHSETSVFIYKDAGDEE